MAIIGVGDQLVLMQGFARQKAIATDPKKKQRRIHFRRYVVPSETVPALGARLCLSEAAVSARGKTYEDVIATIRKVCTGKDFGGKEAAEARKRERYSRADANISRMRAKLGRVV